MIRTTIYLSENERRMADVIKHHYGVRGRNNAIRLSIRRLYKSIIKKEQEKAK